MTAAQRQTRANLVNSAIPAFDSAGSRSVGWFDFDLPAPLSDCLVDKDLLLGQALGDTIAGN